MVAVEQRLEEEEVEHGCLCVEEEEEVQLETH